MISRLSEGLMNDLKILGGCIIKTNTVLETMLLRLEQEVAKSENSSISLTTRKSLLACFRTAYGNYYAEEHLFKEDKQAVKAWLEGMKDGKFTGYIKDDIINWLIRQLEQEGKTAPASQGG